MTQTITSICFVAVGVLSTLTPASAAVQFACSGFPWEDFREESMQCTGPEVTSVPMLLSPSLHHLRLRNTSISWLNSSEFQGRHLPNLNSLHVTHGKLKGVAAGAFCSLTSLVQINLSNNTLEQLDPMSFACNDKVRSIDLSDNPMLRQLPAELASTSAEKLYLSNCGLADVEEGALERLPRVQFLDLSGNPGLDCQSVRRRLTRRRGGLVVTCDDASGSAATPRNPRGRVTQTETTARNQLIGKATHSSSPYNAFILIFLPVLLLILQ